MRKIKFRAWDTSPYLTKEYIEWCKGKNYFLGGSIKVIEKQEIEYKNETGKNHEENKGRMIYDINVSNEGKMMSLEAGWDYQGDCDSAIIMQFTGLLDKNGKEIYEGDLIKTSEKAPLSKVIWSDSRAGFAVIFPNMWNEKLKIFYKSLSWASKGEVVGNIYENKELTEIIKKD